MDSLSFPFPDSFPFSFPKKIVLLVVVVFVMVGSGIVFSDAGLSAGVRMDSDVFLWALIGLVAGLVVFVLGLVWFRQKQLIENTPTSKIRSLAMGMVEVFGEVIPAEKQLLRSPLSGEDCVYYKYAIEEFRQQGKSSSWVTVKRGEERTRFFIKDKTGGVLVDPRGAKIETSADHQYESGFGGDPPQKVLDFLEREGLKHEGFLGFNKKMRFTEHNIVPGDKLYIMGTADDNPFVEEATAQSSHEDIMIQRGRFDKFYFISDKPEKDILSSLGWKSMAGILGGILLTAGSLAVMFLYTGML